MNILHFIEKKILLLFAYLFKIQNNWFWEVISILICVGIMTVLVLGAIEIWKINKKNRVTGAKKHLQRFYLLSTIGLAVIFFIGTVAHVVMIGIIIKTDLTLKDFSYNNEKFSKEFLNVDIYDQRGYRAYTIIHDGVNRETVSLNEMPSYLIDAFVNVEDKNFYHHSGFSIVGYLRAFYYKLVNPDESMHGGSTLTQQLIKNVNGHMYNRTVLHKYQEALVSVIIENKYNKEEILEMYLNRIYLGEGNVYGVGTASKYYFNKHVSELTLTESAYLAGLPQAPSTYTKDLEVGNKRKNTVLGVMKENGAITKNQWEKAKQKEVSFNKKEKVSQSSLDSYADYVLKEAKELYGISEEDLKHKGYDIFTNLDVNLQHTMYTTAQNFTYKDDHNAKGEKVQVGIAAVDPNNTKIIALYGGRDYVRGYRNRSYDYFQPGSILKPLAVYAPALESKKWDPFSEVNDEKRSFNGYEPKNAGDKYEGIITLERALVRSANIPAVALLQDIGVEKGAEALEKVGIELEQKDKQLHLALGGMQKGVTPIQIAQAYTVFQNYGYYQPAKAIKYIKDKNGKFIQPVKKIKDEGVDVFSPEVAYQMTEIMKKVVTDLNGTGKNANIGRPVAGKTGTAEEVGTTGNRSSWFVGYTPTVSMAVHFGFDKPSKELYLTTSGGDEPAKLFASIMRKSLENTQVSDFQKPENATSIEDGPQMLKVENVSAKYNEKKQAMEIKWERTNKFKGIVYHVYQKGKGGQAVLLGTTEESMFLDENIKVKETLTEIPEHLDWFDKGLKHAKNSIAYLKNMTPEIRTYYVVSSYQEKESEPSRSKTVLVPKKED